MWDFSECVIVIVIVSQHNSPRNVTCRRTVELTIVVEIKQEGLKKMAVHILNFLRTRKRGTVSSSRMAFMKAVMATVPTLFTCLLFVILMPESSTPNCSIMELSPAALVATIVPRLFKKLVHRFTNTGTLHEKSPPALIRSFNTSKQDLVIVSRLFTSSSFQ